MKKMAIILIIASLALTACNKKEGGVKTKDESNVIMVIGNENLTESELQEKIDTLPAQYKEYSKSEKGRAALIEEMGCRHVECSAAEAVADPDMMVVTTPAYMTAKGPGEVYAGALEMISKLDSLITPS